MSIIRTKCPTLSDLLSESIGSIDGIDSKMSTKPLCDNIFDVQRNELVEVLQRLRTAFWSDQVTLPQTPPQPQSYKRIFSEPDEDTLCQQSDNESIPVARKRVRSSTSPPPPRSVIVKKSSSSTTAKSLASLWPLKKSMIRHIKTDNRYNEAQVLSILTDTYQTKSTDQCLHLALYLLPVAKAMRRHHVVKLLEQWCL